MYLRSMRLCLPLTRVSLVHKENNLKKTWLFKAAEDRVEIQRNLLIVLSVVRRTQETA